MILTVVRHGRTAWNVKGRFQGHTDVPLDTVGRAQALRLAEHLRADTFAAAVTSDLARARETAEIIVRDRPLALRADARWREMQFGTWEGLTWDEIVARNPQLAVRPSTVPKFYTPENGESFEDLCARVDSAARELIAEFASEQRVLLATHAGPLHALLRVTLGEAAAEALHVRFVPASVTRLRVTRSGAQILSLNESVEGASAPGYP